LIAHALPALGRLIDTDAARTRLVTIAADPSVALAERALALSLLEKHVTATDIAALATLLLDDAQPLELREQALKRIGETHAKEALPTLLSLVPLRQRSLRQPATELAVELGGERTLPAIFRALPSHWNVNYAKSELEAYAARVERLPQSGYLVALLGGKLYSIFWWNRVIALRYFANRADPVEATWRLRLQLDDKQEIIGEGWPPKWTVGREATAALRTLAAR
jgi:HEAT repeat protein